MSSSTRLRVAFRGFGIAIVFTILAQLHLGSYLFSKTPPALPFDSNQQKRRPYSLQNATTKQNQLYDRKYLPKFDPNNPENASPQNPHGGAFVHIGKTGGSTLSRLLRNGCHSYMKHPCYNIPYETPASMLIESYYHVPDFAFLQQSAHDFYLLTLRDPFDRTVSAFVFEHLKNRDAREEPVDSYKRVKYEWAYQCFPSLEVFSAYLKGNSSDFSYPYHKKEVHPESCVDLARAAIHGKVKLYNHFYFGYERIRSFIPDSDSRMYYVARQEHLWEDWKDLNHHMERMWMLPRPVMPEHAYHLPDTGLDRRNTTIWEMRNQLPVGKDLSAKGVQALCKALETEYNSYFWFLQKAENIDADRLQFSVNRAKERCGNSLDMDRMVQSAGYS